MSKQHIGLAEIFAARKRILGLVEETALVHSFSLSDSAGVPVYLKLEHRQITGSFKLRGASNAIALLGADAGKRGVVAASTGNHGRALAYAAKRAGISATICMSRLVPANKVEEIRRLGAQIHIVGSSQDDAQIEVERLVAEEGMVMLPPFDHPAIIAGQGTLGLETMQALPELATVLVPLSGGGLAAGVAAAVKAISPSTKIIGISMERGAAMSASLAAGKPVQVREEPSLADSLGGGIGLDNSLTFSMCRDLLDEVILLSEQEIAAGLRHIYVQEREIVEGAAAVGVGALLTGKIRSSGPIVSLLSGRNIDMDMHRRVVCGENPFVEGQ